MAVMQTVIACPNCGNRCHKAGPLGTCPVHRYPHICQCEFCEGRGTVPATFRDDLGW